MIKMQPIFDKIRFFFDDFIDFCKRRNTWLGKSLMFLNYVFLIVGVNSLLFVLLLPFGVLFSLAVVPSFIVAQFTVTFLLGLKSQKAFDYFDHLPIYFHLTVFGGLVLFIISSTIHIWYNQKTYREYIPQ